MRDDTTIIIHADVYTHEIPSTSDSVMLPGETPMQPSVSSTDLDTLDDARLGRVTPKTPKLMDADTEAIEVVPIVRGTLPSPEPKPKMEMNGFDTDIGTKKSSEREDSDCVVNCLYFVQQCCECTIV